MKNIVARMAVMAAIAVLYAMPAQAAEGMGNAKTVQDQQGQKDECLLVAKACPDQQDTIQQRIERLSREVSKGTAVYSRDELQAVQVNSNEFQQLAEYRKPSAGVEVAGDVVAVARVTA